MPRDAYINARVDKRIKDQAQEALGKVGLSTSDAVNLFLHQVVLYDGLPFEVRVPNEETRAAMAELNAGGGDIHTESTDEIFREVIESDK